MPETAFSGNLRKLRISRELTQKDIAGTLGVQSGTYSNWERGEREPSILHIEALARYFAVSVDKLLDSNSRSLRIGSHRPWKKEATFHPIKHLRYMYDIIYPLMFNHLYCYDIDQRRFNLELSKSWSADAREHSYTFHLRSNLRFHDGTPVKLEDVKESYDLFLSQFPFYRRFVDSVDIVSNENAVKLKLSEWRELDGLPSPYIIPSRYVDECECFVGTGAFMTANEEQQRRIREGLRKPAELVSNNDYFEGAPKIQYTELHRLNNNANLKNALEKRVIDLAYDVDIGESSNFEVNSDY